MADRDEAALIRRERAAYCSCALVEKTKLRERVEGHDMAPRQLRLEPIEVDMGADKGLKRVRVESTEESSTQVQFSARANAWGTAWP
eukprot:scaffold2448_cov119-Isochrysis_galbana.AAC.8